MSTERTPEAAAYAALWDSDQRMRIMVAISAGCPLVVSAGSPLARAELAHQGPNPEDWMLLEAGVDVTTLDDGLWVVEGMVAYGSPVGEDPDVSGNSWAVTYRRPSVVEVLRLSQGEDPWGDAKVEVGPEALAVRVWGSPLQRNYDGDIDADTDPDGKDCDGAPDLNGPYGPVLRATRFTLGRGWNDEVHVEERKQADGTVLWRVGVPGGCWTWSRSGFELEPIPSSCAPEWIAHARWSWAEAAEEARNALDHLRATRRRHR